MGCVKVCLVTRLEKHSGVTQNFRVMQKQPCPFTVYVHVRKYHCMIDKSFSVDPVLRHQRYQQENCRAPYFKIHPGSWSENGPEIRLDCGVIGPKVANLFSVIGRQSSEDNLLK